MDAIHQSTHPAQVGIPAALGDIVRVADSIAKVGGLPADFTFTSHKNTSDGGVHSIDALNILPEIGPFYPYFRA
jgi:hypothetical protein